MNPNTGHLIDTSGLLDQKLREFIEQGYVLIPPELDREARRALRGKKGTHVSVTNQTKLAKFAAKKRKQRRKIAKESRQRNRIK